MREVWAKKAPPPFHNEEAQMNLRGITRDEAVV